MWDLRIPQDWRDELLITLIQENFLNEERFARSFVRGKFNIKKWGRIKIINGLKQHDVSKKCINLALTEINEDEYLKVLRETIELKRSKLKEKNQWKRRSAMYRFALQRGFESSIINEILSES